ncbi:MAG: hypothetical protein HY674_18760 [Chloroflexi bacterium]|nr:hypothetical protein [Chloroflexota bacterium]
MNLDFGERLSPAAERGKTEALEQIRRLVEEADQPPATRLSRQAGNGEVQTMA